MGPTRFSVQIFFHKWLREQWNWKQHLYSCTFSLHTDIQACDEYFGRKEQVVPDEYFAWIALFWNQSILGFGNNAVFTINENVLHSYLKTKKNCSTYVLSEAKLSNCRFMRLGQFYPMAHFSFVCMKNQTIKLEISFGCIQFWIDIEQ